MSSQEATLLVDKYFPEIAERARQCEEHWAKLPGNEEMKMEFGLWWAATINIPTRGSVKTRLHRDWRNVAGGLCAIWVYGA